MKILSNVLHRNMWEKQVKKNGDRVEMCLIGVTEGKEKGGRGNR